MRSCTCRWCCRRWWSGYVLLLLFGTRGVDRRLAAAARSASSSIFTRNGAALATAVMSFPLMVRAMRISLENVDRGLEDAARTLGAGADRSVCHHHPAADAARASLAGAITAFSAALGEFGAVITFVSNIPGETRTLPLALYSALQEPGGEHAAARLAALSVVLGLGGLLLSEWFARRVRAHAGAADAASRCRQAARRLRAWTSHSSCPTPGVVALFGRSGCGKTTVDQHASPACCAGRGRGRAR